MLQGSCVQGSPADTTPLVQQSPAKTKHCSEWCEYCTQKHTHDRHHNSLQPSYSPPPSPPKKTPQKNKEPVQQQQSSSQPPTPHPPHPPQKQQHTRCLSVAHLPLHQPLLPLLFCCLLSSLSCLTLSYCLKQHKQQQEQGAAAAASLVTVGAACPRCRRHHNRAQHSTAQHHERDQYLPADIRHCTSVAYSLAY